MCWQKRRGHIRKKLHKNREIVVQRTVRVWEHTDSWLGAQMGSVPKLIQTLKEYFWCHNYCAHFGTPWYQIVRASHTVSNRVQVPSREVPLAIREISPVKIGTWSRPHRDVVKSPLLSAISVVFSSWSPCSLDPRTDQMETKTNVYAFAIHSIFHCGSAVWFGQALPGYLITAHHLYAHSPCRFKSTLFCLWGWFCSWSGFLFGAMMTGILLPKWLSFELLKYFVSLGCVVKIPKSLGELNPQTKKGRFKEACSTNSFLLLLSF